MNATEAITQPDAASRPPGENRRNGSFTLGAPQYSTASRMLTETVAGHWRSPGVHGRIARADHVAGLLGQTAREHHRERDHTGQHHQHHREAEADRQRLRQEPAVDVVNRVGRALETVAALTDEAQMSGPQADHQGNTRGTPRALQVADRVGQISCAGPGATSSRFLSSDSVTESPIRPSTDTTTSSAGKSRGRRNTSAPPPNR